MNRATLEEKGKPIRIRLGKKAHALIKTRHLKEHERSGCRAGQCMQEVHEQDSPKKKRIMEAHQNWAGACIG